MTTSDSLTIWEDIILKHAFQPKLVSTKQAQSFVAKAIKNDKQAVIVFGANWCPDCQILAGLIRITLENEQIKETFEFLLVDVKDYEINMDSLQEIDPTANSGIPRLFIFDGSGNLLNKQQNDFFRTLRTMHENALVDYLMSFKQS
jgi:thiol-disulfide isomerase/thioredoxin